MEITDLRIAMYRAACERRGTIAKPVPTTMLLRRGSLPWTAAEDATLRHGIEQGLDLSGIWKSLDGRSYASVAMKCARVRRGMG